MAATREGISAHPVYRGISDWYKSFRIQRRPFYRLCGLSRATHAVCRTNNVMTIDARIAISHRHRYVFIRVPKCANTTILATLGVHELGRSSEEIMALDDEQRRTLLRKQNIKQAFDRPSALSARRAREVLASYRVGMFVRNPFTRVASGYLHKVGAGGYTQRAGLPDSLSFAAFCDHLAEGGMYRDIHWLPQVDINPLPVERLDFVGRFESLATDLERFVSLVYGEGREAISRDHHATGANKRLRTLYTDREMEIVARLYAQDFRAFGYDPLHLPA